MVVIFITRLNISRQFNPSVWFKTLATKCALYLYVVQLARNMSLKIHVYLYLK